MTEACEPCLAASGKPTAPAAALPITQQAVSVAKRMRPTLRLRHAAAGRIFASNQSGDFTCYTYRECAQAKRVPEGASCADAPARHPPLAGAGC
jgi:hypothetical protein